MTGCVVFRILAVAALSAGLSGPLAAETAVTPEAPRAALPAITVSTVETRLMRDRLLASGMVGAVERVQVQPLIEGQPIETLEVEIGDRVTEGQVLARLSKTSLELQKSELIASRASAAATVAQAEAQQLEARANADEAQRANARTAQLVRQGAATQAAAEQTSARAISATAGVTVAVQSLEAARAQAKLVEAQIENIDLQLSRTEVVAPVSGEVVERNALVGAVASAAGEPMFAINRDGALELRADVAERDLLRLKPGQVARLSSVAAAEPLTGTVRLVEPSIDMQTRLGRARITVDTPDLLRPGMFVDAEILVAEREALAVPVSAIGASDEGATVMRVRDGLVERVVVQTGIRDAGMVEVVAGLVAGDLVVTKAAAFVRDGDRVNPVPAPAATN
ncbi:efflux RND transporter periplasmic adaptor subunit [Fertoebacter nigrum]|uniref:Efflux RND transporter periplasmic adaptor subunit n=1 Tax=Fertoeibacter niger TaxID=2656921 RepID=A0A8X8H3K1_9RHOB|nr:efflux RND transporter periplasmic adaptor subunit [Fertoeibacter niger]NUB45674.1 efflux RND transporter periplasmic adaptor subunit [Fertoeibacter niger]